MFCFFFLLQKICNCKFDCTKISGHQKLKLFKSFYAEGAESQGMFLMGLLSISNVRRRRNGSYESEQDSRRQCTINYSLPDGNGNTIRVCKRTFMNVFSVSSKRLFVLVNKLKMGETVFQDKRTSHKKSKYDEVDKTRIKEHILSIPRDVSHYSRARSNKEYLSPELNIHRLTTAFNKKFSDNQVSYKYYRKVFLTEFPNLSFRKLRTDTCKTCDLLQSDIRNNINQRAKEIALQKLKLHHLKTEKAYNEMKNDKVISQNIGSNVSCVSVDLQQVLFVPTLTHSDMFYMRQLSCYNFCVNLSDNDQSYMCVWHEGIGSRGANEIASCLLKVLNKFDITQKDELYIWSDNCVGQNKNRMMLFLYIFLVSIGMFKNIHHKFLVSGHSFLQCDRDFSLIEKRKKVLPCYVPSDIHNVISTAKVHRPFKVVEMTETDFIDFQKCADTFLVTTNLHIKKCVSIQVDASQPGFVFVRETFSELEECRKVRILKKGVTINDIKNCEIFGISKHSVISEEKKKDLRAMMPYIPPVHHQFYYDLF